MNKTEEMSQIMIKHGIIAFKKEEGREPTEEEMKHIGYPDQDVKDVFFGAMQEFARREKQEVLQELVNGWVEEDKGGSRNYDSTSLVDYLNFTVFRHRYPAISFESVGDSVTVTVKE